MSDRRSARKGLVVLVSAMAVPAALSDCSFQVSGTAVEMAFESSPPPGRYGEMTVEFERAFLSLEEVELVRCERDAAARALIWLLPSQAKAHGVSTATQLGVSVGLDLTRAISLAGGLLEPPAGRYCAVRVRAAPSDGDGVGAAVDAGRSLVVQGTVSRTERSEAILWRSSSELEQVVPLSPPLVLDANHLNHRVVVSLAPEGWLTADDFEAAGRRVSSTDLLHRILASVRVRHERL